MTSHPIVAPKEITLQHTINGATGECPGIVNFAYIPSCCCTAVLFDKSTVPNSVSTIFKSIMKRRLHKPVIDYTNWTKEQLIQRLQKLEGNDLSIKKRPDRPFDFSAYPKQHVALKVAYFGWGYNGFASQMSYKPSVDGGNESFSNPNVVTVEDILFGALLRCRLIESPRDCRYSRCGRTDTGVSSTSQVIALTVRSSSKKKSPHEPAIFDIPICSMLNRQLPNTIRVLGYSPVPETFDARFSCIGRKYKYFFHGHSLNIDAMREACTKLIGEHDFRNFCRKDKSRVEQSYVRRIDSALIRELNDGMFEFEIIGSAFLYHQVRCIMQILFLVGRELEPVQVVDYMLDHTRCTQLPVYDLASEIPLVLSECFYPDSVGLNFKIDDSEKNRIECEMFKMWRDIMAKSLIVNLLRKDDFDPFLGQSCSSNIFKP